jgi:hypothetical protein
VKPHSSIRYYLELGSKVQLDSEKNKIEILDMDRIADILRIKYEAKGHFPDVHAGIFCHLCGSLSAMALAQHYASEFKSLGGLRLRDCRVTGRRFLQMDQGSKYQDFHCVIEKLKRKN